jgi:catechol 2,3-dioxygenase-like lactoylglutathione lyase family enzyme
MSEIITGIQQAGIGVTDLDNAWAYYRRVFGFDVPVFDDIAEAGLMTRYTGNEIHSRRAVLALNMNGGGGFEIWQFKSRNPEMPDFIPVFGDLGINAVRIKCRNIEKAHRHIIDNFAESGVTKCSAPDGSQYLVMRDPFGNLFQIVEESSWFRANNEMLGGVCGVTIGVSDIDKALPLYKTALGIDTVTYDKTGTFEDLDTGIQYRRILLHKAQSANGAFSRLFGHTQIELIQSLNRKPRKIYDNRFWGDPGFIHVCFDVNSMELLKERCLEQGFPFTVDSADSFDMGEAAGHFSYVEDPDGTLIEFVEAHKLPILKKWGWYMNLKKRKNLKPLPDWMLKTMSFNRVSD